MTFPITKSVLLTSLTFIKLRDNQKLSIHEPLPREYETMAREELKAKLTIFIAELLENNFEKLYNLVYRHDVKEVKFNEALQKESLTEQAESIADLVIERELQKVETRKMFRQNKAGSRNKLSD